MQLSSYTNVTDSDEPQWFDIASDPNSNDIILLIVDKSKACTQRIGTALSGMAPQLYQVLSTLQDPAAAAVAYESTSGRCPFGVWRQRRKNVRYRTQNFGTNTWSTPMTDTILSSAFLNNNARRVFLRADPNSDRVVLGVVDDKFGYAAIWNGTGWQNQESLSGTIELTGNAYPSMAVAFEGQSGNALAVYGEKDKPWVFSERWNSTDGSWSTGPNVTTDRDKSLALTLTSKPMTNDIMMLVEDDGDKLYAWRWVGDTQTFSTKTLLNDPTVTEALEGKLQFVYLWSTGS